MFCAYCGKDIGDKDMFCNNCGKPTVYYSSTHSATATAQQRENGEYQRSTVGFETQPAYDHDELVEQLVGVKTEYYMPKFLDMQYNNKKASWNWCSFFVPVYWLLYRKMYMYAGIYLILSFVLSFMGGLGIVMQIVLGLFGNYIYMTNIYSLASQARALTEADKKSFIAKKGGVSKTAVIIWLAIGIAIGLLVSTFIYAIFIYGN